MALGYFQFATVNTKSGPRTMGPGDTKVLLLHGGPGLNYDYIQVMDSFLPEASFTMYHCDQLGCGGSDRAGD